MNKKYEGVLLEDIQHKLERLIEALAEVPGDVRKLKAHAEETNQRLDVIEIVLKEESRQAQAHRSILKKHDKRIANLEAA